MFVTVEPNNGSHHPTGKQLLFAYLRVNPNHPQRSRLEVSSSYVANCVHPAGLFKLTAADPAPERVVPWIVGVTSQAVVANRSAQSSPGTVRRRYRAVTNVTFLRCTSSYTKVFTLWPRAPLKEDAMREPKPKEQRNSTYKRAGATLYKRGAPAQWSLP